MNQYSFIIVSQGILHWAMIGNDHSDLNVRFADISLCKKVLKSPDIYNSLNLHIHGITKAQIVRTLVFLMVLQQPSFFIRVQLVRFLD